MFVPKKDKSFGTAFTSHTEQTESNCSFIRHPSQTAQTSHQTPVQTLTQIPIKGIKTPYPYSTSAIPHISGPNPSTKTVVVLRNKTNVCQQQQQQQSQQTQQTIVDKIKHSNRTDRTGPLISNGDQTVSQIVVNNRSESCITQSKRTSGSSGFSSAKSDSSSASVCGFESTVQTVTQKSKSKPTVTTAQTITQTVSKTKQTSNQSTQSSSVVSLNTNINNNFSNNNNILKKSQEVLNNCENFKTNLNNSHNNSKSCTTGSKLGSIPVKRIQPPRIRPISTIIVNNSIPSSMASSSQSKSNTSLTSIVKPTAAVKGTSKVLAIDEHRTETHSSDLEQGLQLKANREKCGSQTQLTLNTKHEPSVAMVSPIVAKEQNRCKTIEEEKSAKESFKIKFNYSTNSLKKSLEKNKIETKSDQRINGLQQQSPESSLMDSTPSSHGEGEESNSNSDVDSALIDLKPMAPLVRTSPFALLRSTDNKMCNNNNGTVYSRFPNNYSAIENGYNSDCTLIQSRSCPRSPYRSYYLSAGSTAGYVSDSDVNSPYGKRNQLMAKINVPNNTTERTYKETDRNSLSEIRLRAKYSDPSQQTQMRKLRRELDQANEKVATLTSQLTTNGHMVAAFEQSLSSMTVRLQQLSASSEMKDHELERLRTTIETLKRQGCHQDRTDSSKQSSNANKVKTASLIRRNTFTNDGKGDDYNSRIARQLSYESVSSVSSGTDGSLSNKSKKKSKTAKILNNSSSGWLRSSFSKAFKKNKSIVKRDAFSDAETFGSGNDCESLPNSPLMSSRSFRTDSNTNGNDLNEPEVVQELKRQLREKETVLTDLRLESLTSAHQLENLKETVNQLRAEMLNLKQDNDRLNRLLSSKSLASSQSSMTSGICVPNTHATNGSTFSGRHNGTFNENDGNSLESLEMEAVANALLCDGGKLVTVESGTHIIASLVVTPKTNWDQLDLMIKKSFKEHINRIDMNTGMGLTLDALACYQVGSERIQRTIVANKSSHISNPELLPFGYLVNESHIHLQFKTATDSLVFDTLTPKSIIQRYINLLGEHRRMILCGPSGTGKTYMAHKLAEYLAIKRVTEGRSPGPIDCCPAGSIALFSVDHRSAKELRAYLTNVAEQCESETLSQHLPTVIILDNLHHVGSIDDVFNGLINITHTKCPYIIGTMNQTTCMTANLQIHHNFRWVLCTNDMEPVKGFLSRYLKRKLIETEVKMASNSLSINPELYKIIDWIPKLWNHLNQFLKSHSSPDVTIGPRLFSWCPIDINSSQIWFRDLWNHSIVPYVVEATREGIQMYGQRITFVDPTEWVCESYPWTANGDWTQQLLRITAEDVNYENTKQNYSDEGLVQSSSDPLLNMLMRLQEAANYSNSNSSQPNQSYNQNNGNHNNNTTSVSIVNSGIESTL